MLLLFLKLFIYLQHNEFYFVIKSNQKLYGKEIL